MLKLRHFNPIQPGVSVHVRSISAPTKTGGLDLVKRMQADDGTTINMLLEAFQECKRRGEHAKLFLETRNGTVFTNFSAKIPVSRPGTTSTLQKKKTPSSLRRDQERMAKFLMKKKKSRGSFSTSTPKASNQISSTSSNQAMEMTSEADSVSCETAGLDTRAGEQNGDDTETTKEKKEREREIYFIHIH